MCIIAICETEKPTNEMLEKFNSSNGDGFGVGWFEKDNLAYYKKGMNLNEVKEFVAVLKLPFIIHARLASCGGKSLLLTHPYEITEQSELKFNGSSERLLFQNGHLSIKDVEIYLYCAGIDVLSTDLMTDTRAISMILSKNNTMILSKNNNESFLLKLSGRWAIMDGKTKTIRMWGDWDKKDTYPGIQFSNMIWDTKKITHTPYTNKTHYPKKKKTHFPSNEVIDPHGLLTPAEMVQLTKPERKELRAKRRLEKGLPEPTTHPNAHNKNDEVSTSDIKTYLELEPSSKFNNNNTRRILGFPPVEEPKKLFSFQPNIRPYLPPGCPSLGLPQRKLIGFNRETEDADQYCG